MRYFQRLEFKIILLLQGGLSTTNSYQDDFAVFRILDAKLTWNVEIVHGLIKTGVIVAWIDKAFLSIENAIKRIFKRLLPVRSFGCKRWTWCWRVSIEMFYRTRTEVDRIFSLIENIFILKVICMICTIHPEQYLPRFKVWSQSSTDNYYGLSIFERQYERL